MKEAARGSGSRIGVEPLGDDSFGGCPARCRTGDGGEEVVAGEGAQPHRRRRDDGGRSRDIPQQRDLTEAVAVGEARD